MDTRRLAKEGGDSADRICLSPNTVTGELTCSICFEIFESPRTLPSCLHTFCEECLFKVFIRVSNDFDPVYQCPVCRKTVKPPPYRVSTKDWIKEFPVNHVINTLLADFKKREDKTPALKGISSQHCSLCSALETTEFCFDCHEFMCQKCVDLHKHFKVTRQHRTVSVSGMENLEKQVTELSRNIICPEHTDKTLEFYCETDNKPLCVVCATVSHKKCNNIHSLADHVRGGMIVEKAKTAEKELNGFKSKLKIHEIVLMKNKEIVKEDLRKTITLVSDITKRSIMKLIELEKQTISNCKILEKQIADTINDTLQSCKTLGPKIQELILQLEVATKFGSDVQKFLVMNNIKTETLMISQQIDKNHKFSNNYRMMFNESEILAKLMMATAVGQPGIQTKKTEIQAEDEKDLPQHDPVSGEELSLSNSRLKMIVEESSSRFQSGTKERENRDRTASSYGKISAYSSCNMTTLGVSQANSQSSSLVVSEGVNAVKKNPEPVSSTHILLNSGTSGVSLGCEFASEKNTNCNNSLSQSKAENTCRNDLHVLSVPPLPSAGVCIIKALSATQFKYGDNVSSGCDTTLAPSTGLPSTSFSFSSLASTGLVTFGTNMFSVASASALKAEDCPSRTSTCSQTLEKHVALSASTSKSSLRRVILAPSYKKKQKPVKEFSHTGEANILGFGFSASTQELGKHCSTNGSPDLKFGHLQNMARSSVSKPPIDPGPVTKNTVEKTDFLTSRTEQPAIFAVSQPSANVATAFPPVICSNSNLGDTISSGSSMASLQSQNHSTESQVFGQAQSRLSPAPSSVCPSPPQALAPKFNPSTTGNKIENKQQSASAFVPYNPSSLTLLTSTASQNEAVSGFSTGFNFSQFVAKPPMMNFGLESSVSSASNNIGITVASMSALAPQSQYIPEMGHLSPSQSSSLKETFPAICQPNGFNFSQPLIKPPTFNFSLPASTVCGQKPEAKGVKFHVPETLRKNSLFQSSAKATSNMYNSCTTTSEIPGLLTQSSTLTTRGPFSKLSMTFIGAVSKTATVTSAGLLSYIPTSCLYGSIMSTWPLSKVPATTSGPSFSPAVTTSVLSQTSHIICNRLSSGTVTSTARKPLSLMPTSNSSLPLLQTSTAGGGLSAIQTFGSVGAASSETLTRKSRVPLSQSPTSIHGHLSAQKPAVTAERLLPQKSVTTEELFAQVPAVTAGQLFLQRSAVTTGERLSETHTAATYVSTGGLESQTPVVTAEGPVLQRSNVTTGELLSQMPTSGT